ncbi:MAG: 16S rRNA (adenine(1518)-N(6)/adenine(1519)-N(6))-dimethyltransferase RsmA [Candidatus Paceibacterota bacterium]|jgi:16S rRNA (adenine1518-N6/adenine1519-N6)-dimethyltransferase
MPQRLGQHFLKDKDSLEKIVEALKIEKGDFIVEIGPGHGELTRELRAKNSECRIITIEKDPRLASWILDHKSDDKIEVIQGDALKVLPQIVSRFKIHDPGYKLVGNIPYYITGYLFRIIADLEPKPEIIVFTIQKEVAERIMGKDGMNLLAASIQFWAKPEIIDYIPKAAFQPQPKVNSAIIKLTPCSFIDYELQTEYYKLIKIIFKQPRKTILNNLSAGTEKNKPEISKLRFDISSKLAIEEILKKAGIDPGSRPQNLSINQLTALSTLF